MCYISQLNDIYNSQREYMYMWWFVVEKKYTMLGISGDVHGVIYSKQPLNIRRSIISLLQKRVTYDIKLYCK